MPLTLEQLRVLTSNGWTVVQSPQSPDRAIHLETGSTATGLAAELVAQALTAATPTPATAMGELLLLHARMRSWIDAAHESARAGNDIWSETFDKVFSDTGSSRVWGLLKELDLDFDYYNPDCGYDDDVLAFWRAFDEFIQNLGKEKKLEM